MSAPLDPHRHKLFTDRDLGRMIWRSLREAGADVEAHDDAFPKQDTPDVEWIPHVARAGRVALTRNKYIRYTSEDAAAVMASGARLFVLMGSRISHADWAAVLAASLERLYGFIDLHEGPWIAKVHRRGRSIECGIWMD